MDTNYLRELLDQRDELDAKIAAHVTGQKERKPQRCGNCLEEGHSSRTCSKPKKEP